MAQRKTVRTKPKARGPEAAEKSARGVGTSRLAALERERDALRAELEAARQRIAALEAQRNQAVDRIDWVIDSLQHVIEAAPSAQP